MRSARRASALLFAAIAVPTTAADHETQHALDVTLPVRRGIELTLHSRIRTQPFGLGFYQVRVGPIVSWDISKKTSLIAGYYYAQQERSADRDFIAGHRLFAGAEVDAIKTRRFAVNQRFLAERFLSDAAPDFNRYRLRSRLSALVPLAPYTSHEFFFDAHGWRSSRHSAGVRWSVMRGVEFDMGYLYEYRRPNVGRNRHMWMTVLHFKRSPRRSDPDL
jgi:hypothetical protein